MYVEMYIYHVSLPGLLNKQHFNKEKSQYILFWQQSKQKSVISANKNNIQYSSAGLVNFLLTLYKRLMASGREVNKTCTFVEVKKQKGKVKGESSTTVLQVQHSQWSCIMHTHMFFDISRQESKFRLLSTLWLQVMAFSHYSYTSG